MNKEQQDLAWACLPKEVRKEIRAEYLNAIEGSDLESFLQDFFGHHNLTSDTEPEDKEPVIRQVRKYWTNSEVKFLTENFDKLTDEIMATRLNKSVRAITLKRKKLGLKKDYEMPVLNKKVCGVGHCDVADVRHDSNADAYTAWVSMLKRCYDEKALQRAPTYRGCSVCGEWLTFSNFRKWFYAPENGYKRGLHLDKDLIQIGNKVYSPDTCCFLPVAINSVVTNKYLASNKTRVKKIYNKYYPVIKMRDKLVSLGSYYTKEEADNAYKRAKESYVYMLADECYKKGDITKRVYDAMLNFKME